MVTAPAGGAGTDALLDSWEVPSPAHAAAPELGIEELATPAAGEAEEIELEELPPEPPVSAYSSEPEFNLEPLDEEVVEEEELGPVPSYGAVDDEPSPSGDDRAELPFERGEVSTAPVSVELSDTAGPTDIAIPVEVSLRNGARVQLNIRLTLNLTTRR
jgi:hypothetical protein